MNHMIDCSPLAPGEEYDDDFNSDYTYDDYINDLACDADDRYDESRLG